MRALACIALVSIPCTAVAQTTWTSFADRRGHMMAATPSQGVVMFGGESVTSPGTLLGDTHELSTNNQTWTQGGEDGPSAPAPTSHGSMAATTIAGQATYVMFGGTVLVGSSPVPSARTYRYDGTAWGDHSNGTHPSARAKHVMVTNPVTNTMFLFGGYDGAQALDDMWEFAPQTDSWVVRNAGGNGPTTRFGHAMAFHPHGGGTNGRIYVFGGSSFDSETWEYNPNTHTWTQLFPAAAPPGRYLASMAYVAVGSRLVLFGGLGLGPGGATVLGDTWEFTRSGPTGTPVWTQVSSANPPPPRYEHSLTTGSSGSDVVLLGGTNALPVNTASTVLEETWTYSLLGGWVRTVPAPTPRDGAAMAYDSVRNRHVVFGGSALQGGAVLDETWELEGLNWRNRTTPSLHPPHRSDAGMAFDESRARIVLFGGKASNGQDLADTWEWNGASWVSPPVTQSPPPASGCPLTYDSARNRVFVLIGSTMWSYDGIAWKPDAIPPAGETYSCGWDPNRGRLEVLGGRTDPATPRVGFWEWSGTAWSRVSASGEPSWRFRHAMAYDTVNQEMVVFGGLDFSWFFYPDTYAWDGTSWTLRSQSGPVGRQLHAMVTAFSPRRQVMFGGASSLTGAFLNDTWEWDGLQWSPGGSSSSVPPREGPHMAFDPVRNKVVMYGGLAGAPGNSPKIGDTWEYDGSQWTQQLPDGAPGSPGPRFGAAMAWDPATMQVLLFGGYDNAGIRDETWTWNGTAWTQRFPAQSPQPRADAGLVNDGTRLLLFSGWEPGSGATFNDIWTWSGSSWQIVDSGTPSSRAHYGAAYDEGRGRTVVFGGRTSNGPGTAYLNETWEWDGDSWLQRAPAGLPPSARSHCAMSYDRTRARVVLYGGTDGTSTLDDTWEWDGVSWMQRTPAVNAPGSSGHTLSFDGARNLTIAFGSFGTWDYGPIDPGTALPPAQSRPGCPTSVSLGQNFTLKPLPWTGPWVGDAIEMEFQNAPPGLGMFVWGFSDWGLAPSIPLFVFNSPNCFLHESADILEVLPPSATRYTSSFAIPNVPAAVGFKLYGQGAWFDLGAPVFPTIVTTNELVFTVGSK